MAQATGLAGTTSILLLDGAAPPLAELAESPTTAHFIYAVDPLGRIAVDAIAILHQADPSPLIELTFDDNSQICCTPTQQFLLRAGSWQQAQNLTIDDSLFAGYFDESRININTNPYLTVLQPTTGTYEFVHRLADDYNARHGLAAPIEGGFVRHHVNFNRYDNRPSNILRMTWLEHMHLHAEQLTTLWQDETFRQNQRAGVQQFYADNPEVIAERRQRMISQNQDATFRAQNGPRITERLRKYHEEHPEVAQQRGEILRQLWQDPAYRAKMSRALTGIEKRPLTSAQKTRVARIISEKSRTMWQDQAKRSEIISAIITALADPDVRARISENSQRRWQDPAYRAKYAPDHHRKIALRLWQDPATREMHRDKILRQWEDPTFRAAHLEGRKREYAQRLERNPNAMAEMTAKAKVALTEKWQDADYKRQIMRTKIAGYVARLLAEFGRDQITPELYDAQRSARWIPKSKKIPLYFDDFTELLDVAATHNHRVVAIRWLEELASVYAIATSEFGTCMLSNGCVIACGPLEQ